MSPTYIDGSPTHMESKGKVMDPKGHIYEGTEENPVKPEDAARLDGYLKGRAESDAAAQKKEEEDIKAFLAEKAAEQDKAQPRNRKEC